MNESVSAEDSYQRKRIAVPGLHVIQEDSPAAIGEATAKFIQPLR